MTRRTINRPMLAVLIGIVLGALFAGVALTIYAQRADQAVVEKEAVVDVAAPVLVQLREQCQTDPGRTAVRELGLSCSEVTSGADTVVNSDPPAATTRTIVVQGEQGPPPSPEAIARVVRSQIGGVIRTICGGTCAGDPGTNGTDGPSLEEVLAATSPSISLQITDLFQACVDSGRCVGPRGESVKGDKGDSVKGEPGDDAYPFTFRFTQLGTTYTCQVLDPATTADCAADEPPVDPEPEPTPTAEPTDTGLPIPLP